MSSLLMAYRFGAAHPYVTLLAAWLLLSLLIAVTPQRYRAHPVYGAAVRLAARLSLLTHPDAPGTLQWPIIARAILAGTALPPVLESAPADPSPRGPGAAVALMAGTLAAMALAGTLAACSGQQQPHSWQSDAHAAIAGLAHAEVAAEAIAADRYSAEAGDAGSLPALDVLEHRYSTARSAIHVARASLHAAAEAIHNAEVAGDSEAKCMAYAYVAMALADARALVPVLRAAGLQVPAVLEPSFSAVNAVAIALAPDCLPAVDGGR